MCLFGSQCYIEKSLICQLTSQMTTMSKFGSDQSQELHLDPESQATLLLF